MHCCTSFSPAKDLVTVPLADLQRCGAALQRDEEVQA
jgi:hypothetical protein